RGRERLGEGGAVARGPGTQPGHVQEVGGGAELLREPGERHAAQAPDAVDDGEVLRPQAALLGMGHRCSGAGRPSADSPAARATGVASVRVRWVRWVEVTGSVPRGAVRVVA